MQKDCIFFLQVSHCLYMFLVADIIITFYDLGI